MRLSLLYTARVQLGIVLVGLLLIAGASALLTYMDAKHHDQHYVGMALIGHQRELAQQLSWLALADPQTPEFAAAAGTFQNNLRILSNGGGIASPGEQSEAIAAIEDPLVLATLDSTSAAWQAFRADAQTLWSLPLTAERSKAIRALRDSHSALSHNLVELEELYEHHMEADIAELKRMNIAALLSAIPLLIWGSVIIRRRIVRPLAVLAAAAQPARHESSAPHLYAEAYNDEIGPILQSFQITRPEIDAATRLVESQISERTRLFMSAFEFSQEIVGQMELHKLLKLAAEKAMLLLGAHSSAICLFENEHTYLELVSAQGKVAASIGLRARSQVGLPIQLIELADAAGNPAPCLGCAFRQACHSALRVSAPLQIGSAKIGSLCVVRDQNHPFDLNDRRALELFGSVAAVAIGNAQLALSSRYNAQQSAVLAERKRMAAELHDNLSQTLSYLGLRVERAKQLVAATESDQALSEIDGIQSATYEAYAQVRTMLSNLREPALEGSIVRQAAAAITAFVADFRRVTGLEVDLALDEADVARLAPLAQAQMLNIIREALTNVHRHARATHIGVRAWKTQEVLHCTIQDNGIGFDRSVLNTENKFGLAIMQARAERSAGRLAIHSELGKGTTISAVFPLSIGNQSAEVRLDPRCQPVFGIE
jgi:two-component system nitrate/nitrite sensor histidine kinase NarX